MASVSCVSCTPTPTFTLENLIAYASDQVTAWTGMIRVDGKTYTWMGDPGVAPLVQQTSLEYTSTKSIFTMAVESKVELTITFLSPLTPNDQKRQSLLFSYLDVAVESIDGSPHDVQIYTDISAGRSLLKH